MNPAEAEALQQQLLAVQNVDGGWPYYRPNWVGGSAPGSQAPPAKSWTEPTALALIACRAFGLTAEPYQKGLSWLAAQQKADGGWAPNELVDPSTSVTSLALMALLPSIQYQGAVGKAIDWTAQHVYSSQLTVGLVLARVLGLPPAHAPGSVPWFPGTAGWVIPTSMSILALSQAIQSRNLPKLPAIVQESQSYLLSRTCADGGWNHGGSNTRSEDANSYPETTGIALLALASLPNHQLTAPLALAQRLVRSPESLEGLSWLEMGLMANGVSIAESPLNPRPRTCRDISLRLLALAMRQGLYSFGPDNAVLRGLKS